MQHEVPSGMYEHAPVPTGTNGQRVLIVDDESTIRIALRRFFTRLGWTVEEAANGEIALSMLTIDAEQLELPQFALVVSDLRMPGLSGIEMYNRLLLEQPTVLRRIIFSTGDLVSEDAARFVRTTECIVLQKPFELATLREIVDRVLANAAR